MGVIPWILGIGALAIGALRLRGGNRLETVIKAQVHRVDFRGVLVNVSVLIKNPSNGSITFKYPYVKISHRGGTIGSSTVIDEDITLEKFGETEIRNIFIDLPFMGLAQFAMAFARATANKEPVSVEVGVVTTIHPGIKFASEESIQLTKGGGDGQEGQ